MLPPAELDDAINENDFSDDSRDAYGEIANIISGVYTGLFEESYIKSLRFIRTDIEEVVSLTVDTSSDEPMADQDYYMSCGTITIEGKSYGKIHMLFPLSLLQLEGIQQGQKVEEVKSNSAIGTDSREKARSLPQEEERTYEEKEKGAEILLMSDDVSEAEKIRAVLERSGYSVKMLSFKNNINNYISSSLKAVFLVLREVNEQTFGVMIKVSSSSSVPLITAGPAWTRTKVIKAVKYGVNDILLTPASEQDIQEKIDNNLVQLAA
jgi:ActR/RegA family two-component response regulator